MTCQSILLILVLLALLIKTMTRQAGPKGNVSGGSRNSEVVGSPRIAVPLPVVAADPRHAGSLGGHTRKRLPRLIAAMQNPSPLKTGVFGSFSMRVLIDAGGWFFFGDAQFLWLPGWRLRREAVQRGTRPQRARSAS